MSQVQLSRRHLLIRTGVISAQLTLLGLARPTRASDSATNPRRVRYSITLTNPGGEALREQLLWAYVPMAITSSQRLIDLTVSIPYTWIDDEFGHRIICLKLAALAPWEQRVISIGAELDISMSPSLSHLASRSLWMRAERYIETADTELRSLADQLKQRDARATAGAIYEWVRAHLTYAGYIAEDLGAAKALRSRRGDCTEFSYLAVALARICGIPARLVGGYVVTGDSVLRGVDYHDWAEVHIDGAWRLLDAQKGNWLESTTDYIAFRQYSEGLTNPVGLAHRFVARGGMVVQL